MAKGKSKIPPPPAPSAEELALIQKQTQSLDFYIQGMEEQKAQNKQQGLIAQISSGLYDPVVKDGVLVDAVLNPANVEKLQAQFKQNEDLQQLAYDRYTKALKGELPVSEGTLQAKEHDFELLKAHAADAGIQIQGNTLDEAATMPQNSTAGNELVSRLHKTYKLQEGAEATGTLASMAPPRLGADALNLSGAATSQYGPGASAGGYIPAIGAAGQIQSPFAAQRASLYQASVNQAALDSQGRSSQYNLGGQVLGLGASYLASKGGQGN